ncbi:MAG: TlpA family protein disulfide reductase [Caldilineales bacterium]|nr:TlpA family protein disulfide reductase [Caldilineales bacterium]MDW8316636.1 TlpA disulfide reductase family protein [Anaerolineae bacterium]
MSTNLWRRLTLAAAAALLVVALSAGCGGGGGPAANSGDGSLPVASTARIDNRGRGLEKGDLAPDFALSYPDGTRTRLSDLKGQAVVMNFWASWCAPCKEEMPGFAKAHRRYSDEGVVIIGINAQETAEQAQKFLDQVAVPFTVALDTRGEVMQAYNVRGLPTTVFIDREGRIAVRYAGLLSEQQLEAFIAQIK